MTDPPKNKSGAITYLPKEVKREPTPEGGWGEEHMELDEEPPKTRSKSQALAPGQLNIIAELHKYYKTCGLDPKDINPEERKLFLKLLQLLKQNFPSIIILWLVNLAVRLFNYLLYQGDLANFIY